MPKRTIEYDSWQLDQLTDAATAAHYLNAAHDDSDEMFLVAVRNVAQARQVSGVAQRAGIERESLYRAFSPTGNPRMKTFRSVLGALGLDFRIVPAAKTEAVGTPRHSRSRRYRTQRVAGSTVQFNPQAEFAFASLARVQSTGGRANAANWLTKIAVNKARPQLNRLSSSSLLSAGEETTRSSFLPESSNSGNAWSAALSTL